MLGGAIGTYGRYYLNILTNDSIYPIGTFLENLIGSFLLGFLTAWFITIISKEWVKLGLGVGVCGGFTTMSMMAADTFSLIETFSYIYASIYVVGSVFGGILFALSGFLIGTVLSKKVKNPRKEVNGN